MNRPSHLITVAALLGCAQAALAQDMLPRRKPGLWETSMEVAQKPGAPMKAQHCVDAKSDAAMQRRVLAGEGTASCRQSGIDKHSGGLEMIATCKTPRGTTINQIRLSGNMRSDYRLDITTRFDPPIRGLTEARRTITAKWAGACPAGMKPGDIRIDGKVVAAQGKAG